jgi:hypothetical protein
MLNYELKTFYFPLAINRNVRLILGIITNKFQSTFNIYNSKIIKRSKKEWLSSEAAPPPRDETWPAPERSGGPRG